MQKKEPEIRDYNQILHENGKIRVKQIGWKDREPRKSLGDVSGDYFPKGKGRLNIQVKDIASGGVMIAIISKTMPLMIGSSGTITCKYGMKKKRRISRGSICEGSLGAQWPLWTSVC